MLLTYGTSLIFTLLSATELPVESSPPKEPLPLGVVLDSQGNPISIPTTNQTALDYQSKEATVSSTKKTSHGTKKKANKKAKSQSRKQKLASRDKIANDPSCRWLSQRMTELEKNIKRDKGHHKKELKIRNKEWKCMKCGAEGPKQEDYALCQYKR